MLNAKSKTFGNLAGHVKGMEGVNSLAQWTNSQFDPTLNWKDVAWIRSLWPGKLIVKGILDVEDAKLATKSGADAIVVSNHGGRQLDGAPSSIAMLPKIADAVGSDIEVMFDGGIRSGQDLFRALALGAKSCLIGRAYIYGLGALGKQGVTTAIETIRKELDITMALTGVTSIADIDPTCSRPRRSRREPGCGGRPPAKSRRSSAGADPNSISVRNGAARQRRRWTGGPASMQCPPAQGARNPSSNQRQTQPDGDMPCKSGKR